MDRTEKTLPIDTVAKLPHSLQHSIPGEVSRTKTSDRWEDVSVSLEETQEFIEVALVSAKKQAFKAMEENWNNSYQLFLKQQAKGLRVDEEFPDPDYPEDYTQVDLSEYEIEQATQYAIVRAKKAKHSRLTKAAYWEKINQKLEKPTFTADDLHFFITNVRAPELGIVPNHNEYSLVLYNALLHYHTGDQEKFVETLRAHDVEVDGKIKNPYCVRSEKLSVDKGIALLGKAGTGKSTLMRLFSRNSVMSYVEVRASHFENIYNEGGKDSGGKEALRPFFHLRSSKGRFSYWLNQSQLGLWIDDVGTEEVGLKFTRCKTVATVLVERYERYFLTDNNLPFFATHFTSNLSLPAFRERYGDRLYDRLKESYNVLFFHPDAPSRR